MRKILLSALLTASALPSIGWTQVPGVAALIEQGRYWRSKGRHDLADQAYRRALALDPANAEARRGLNATTDGAANRPAPRRAPTPAPAAAAERPA
ncbi:tetratricopeptide repeat protein, partial [Sphingobium estronivorans]|uniref:tetratricopeptide repeat protein n=1 Tax=Sphingobium estronivorans TaxID=1577690 RepID=UPI001F087DD4